MNHIERLAGLYLDLMERVLLGVIYEDPPIDQWSGGVFNPALRAKGRDWPAKAHTMIGFERLRNIRELMSHVIGDQVPGDFVETGVWRGGACIYMRAVLKVFGIEDRRIWVADSFAGLPKPDFERYPAQDQGDVHHTFKELAVSLETVQENFRKYDLLDDQVRFLKGWFKDTLPDAPIDASRCCGWTATCTRRPWTRCRRWATRSARGASSSSTTSAPSRAAAGPSPTIAAGQGHRCADPRHRRHRRLLARAG